MVDHEIKGGGRLLSGAMIDMHLHFFRQFCEWILRAAGLRYFKKLGLTDILVCDNFKNGVVEIDPALWLL